MSRLRADSLENRWTLTAEIHEIKYLKQEQGWSIFPLVFVREPEGCGQRNYGATNHTE